MKQTIIKNVLPWPFLLGIVMISILIIIGGFLLYNSQRNRIVNEKQNELAAISSLKIAEIENWRREHIRDGEILRSFIPRNQLVYSFIKNVSPSELGIELLERLKIFISNYDYHSVLLIDNMGSIRLAYPPMDKPFHLNDSQLHDLQNPDISFSDLHYSDDLPGKIHVDLQIPLVANIDNKMVRFGTMLLRIDPEKILYPLIQSWPTPSKSSETLLIRKEDDSVLFLNELRHRENSALNFRLSLAEDLPASAALSGKEGVFEGIDYRGIPVISYLTKIPDTPWFMVAKVDKKEIYSALNELIIIVLVGTFLLIFSFSSIIIYFWRNQHIRYLNELNSTKDKFFSIVSHDLKSPFAGIYGLTNLMIEDLDRNKFSKVREYAGLILDSLHNALDLLKNLTEWSRINSNQIAFNPREIDLITIIDDVVETMQAPAVQKSITITKETPSQLRLSADKEMISSVFRNLISNSIKFSNPGGKVHIAVSENEDKAIVKVSDFGVGIEQERIEKLFQIGENVSTPGTQREQGTGLGLILVKEFISIHGGQVSVKSEVGKCSSFKFTLPLN
jgi:signal transduction histidine kinase